MSPKWDIEGGIHSGVFDCNQTNKYPVNFGASFHILYYPEKSLPWFGGLDLGAFYVSGTEDPERYGRSIKSLFASATIMAGYEYRANTSRNTDLVMRFAAGLPYVAPLTSSSSGDGFLESGSGLGISLHGAVDLPNRLTLFGTFIRLSTDLDGFGYENDETIHPANEHQVTYIAKIGVAWNFR